MNKFYLSFLFFWQIAVTVFRFGSPKCRIRNILFIAFFFKSEKSHRRSHCEKALRLAEAARYTECTNSYLRFFFFLIKKGHAYGFVYLCTHISAGRCGCPFKSTLMWTLRLKFFVFYSQNLFECNHEVSWLVTENNIEQKLCEKVVYFIDYQRAPCRNLIELILTKKKYRFWAEFLHNMIRDVNCLLHLLHLHAVETGGVSRQYFVEYPNWMIFTKLFVVIWYLLSCWNVILTFIYAHVHSLSELRKKLFHRFQIPSFFGKSMYVSNIRNNFL